MVLYFKSQNGTFIQEVKILPSNLTQGLIVEREKSIPNESFLSPPNLFSSLSRTGQK